MISFAKTARPRNDGDVMLGDMEMPLTQPIGPQQATVEEYLAFCEQNEGRFEYHARRIVPIAAGSLNHGRIADNICRELGSKLVDRPCEAFSGQVGVAVRATGDYLFPDASALCGEPDVVTLGGIECVANLQAIIEVLSPSTARRDRYGKFTAYSTIAALVEYMLVEQDAPGVMLLRRQAGGPWTLTTAAVATLDDVVRLESIGVELSMRAIYAKVQFDYVEQTAIVPLDKPDARGR